MQKVKICKFVTSPASNSFYLKASFDLCHSQRVSHTYHLPSLLKTLSLSLCDSDRENKHQRTCGSRDSSSAMEAEKVDKNPNKSSSTSESEEDSVNYEDAEANPPVLVGDDAGNSTPAELTKIPLMRAVVEALLRFNFLTPFLFQATNFQDQHQILT